MTNNTTFYDFNRSNKSLQVAMNFNVETMIPEDGKVSLVCTIVERMNLSTVISTYSKRGRKPVLDPVTFLKIILFCYSEGIFHSRKIEKFCIYDLRARYFLNGNKAPDHSTISRFQNMLNEHTASLLTDFVQMMVEEGHINLKTLYIDGTKIESAANRYTFVWRKTVEKNREKLIEKLIEKFGLPKGTKDQEVYKSTKVRFNQIRNLCERKKIQFVYGSGNRKTVEQREYEYLEKALDRLETYRNHLEIMGDRNSYSKTDQDATFMRMKEDHMRNGQLKPAYNIQLASTGAFIVGVMGSQKANDLHTLKPFLNQMFPAYGKSMKNIVADAGYESVENYVYLNEKNLVSYIKPSNYEVKKTKKSKDDIGRKENMLYLEDKDVYLCKAGKELVRGHDRKKQTSSGFEDLKRTYTCSECSGCDFAPACIKPRKNTNPTQKSIIFSPAFEEFRRQSEHNIMTDVGINYRINRSIQAEGAFAKMKDGLSYTRFRHRSMNKVVSDLTLVALGLNINKLHQKIIHNQTEMIEYKKVA